MGWRTRSRGAWANGFVEPAFPKAMLARLEAGQHIDTDGGGSHPLVHKVHVPLQTNPRAWLTVDGARIHFIFEVFEGAGRAVQELRR